MNEKISINVFVSYSHDSNTIKDIVLGFSNQLRKQGVNCVVDQYEESPKEGWAIWMDENIHNAHYVLVVCTEGYYKKIDGASLIKSSGVKWEGAIITQALYEAGENTRFIPIVLDEASKKFIPRMLRQYTSYNLFSDYEKIYRRITRQPSVKKPELGEQVILPSGNVVNFPLPAASVVNQSQKGSNNVQINNLNAPFSIHGVSPGRPKVIIPPPPKSIGANSALRISIQEKFNKIGDERRKRFGDKAFSVLYKNFKRDFDIKNNQWTIIWMWPEECADAIIKYLDEKYSNTISGRAEGAINKGTLIPAKGHLFAREKDLLSQLDLETSDQWVKDALKKYFGASSHTQMSRVNHWHWVLMLEGMVKNKFNAF